MPIYEYECEAKGHRFEVQQKISDSPLTACKICNAPVRRLISPTSFVLKGGGWYSDAYSGQGKTSSSSDAKKLSTTDKKPVSSPAENKSEKADTTTKAKDSAAK